MIFRNIKIRPAKVSDRKSIISFIELFKDDVFIKNDQLIREALDEWLSNPLGRVSLAVLNNKIVGFAYREIIEGHYIWGGALRVHPNYRRRGIGRALMEETLEMPKKENLPSYDKWDTWQLLMGAVFSRMKVTKVGTWVRMPIENLKVFSQPANKKVYMSENYTEIEKRLKGVFPLNLFFRRHLCKKSDLVSYSLEK